jgi:two-component system, cell cycle sensor histidine kinase and response regulator CckA
MLRVTDTGVGMSAEVQSHAFEPFFTTKPQGEGTGLGLATVYGIVKQSDGCISLSSFPGDGTTFRVYLPQVEAAAVAVPAAATTPTKGHERILLVEDEEVVRRFVRDALEYHGYSIVEAQDAHSALRAVAPEGPEIHLILSDVVLPGMSGPRLLEKLLAVCPRAKVLFTSGYLDVSQHGVLRPDTPFLRKPFSPDALARKVREVLDAL